MLQKKVAIISSLCLRQELKYNSIQKHAEKWNCMLFRTGLTAVQLNHSFVAPWNNKAWLMASVKLNVPNSRNSIFEKLDKAENCMMFTPNLIL